MRENPGRPDFFVHEIVERVLREGLSSGYRPGVQIHASSHCVAGKPPNPACHRMLSETGRGRRRLFRPGDKFHRHRKAGKIHPDRADIPAGYRYLLDWYEQEYAVNGIDGRHSSPGGTVADLMRFVGSIAKSDLRKMETSALARSLPVLACDSETADRYGILKHELRRKGRPVPDNDIWVAATSQQHELTLITRDRHFRQFATLAADFWQPCLTLPEPSASKVALVPRVR